jgi:hypothetical protein
MVRHRDAGDVFLLLELGDQREHLGVAAALSTPNAANPSLLGLVIETTSCAYIGLSFGQTLVS